MSLIILPSVGSTGLYTLSPPFNSLLTPNTPYTCRAIRKLEDIVSSGNDPYELFYKENNVSLDTYNTDVLNGECIVSLQSGNGEWVYVPSSSILSYPSVNGVKYRAVIVGISLGAIPDGLDLSGFQEEVINLTTSVLGIKATTKVAVVSQDQIVSSDSHIGMEIIRKNNITMNNSTLTKLAQVTAERDTALAKIKELETFIQTKYLNP